MWKYWIMAVLMTAIFSTLARAETVFDVTPCPCAMMGISLEGKPWNVQFLSNGLADYMVDLNDDGKADIEYLLPDGEANKIPLFIWVNNEDGSPRYTIKDSLRDGTCKGMAIVWSIFEPKKPNWKGGA